MFWRKLEYYTEIYVSAFAFDFELCAVSSYLGNVSRKKLFL